MIKFKGFSEHERLIANKVFLEPNIKQYMLAATLTQYKISGGDRYVRQLVNSIRNKGWQIINGEPYYLIADSNGYNWEKAGSERAIKWKEKTLHRANELHKLVLTFDNL